LRHHRQLKDETTTEPLPLPRSRTSWAVEPLLVFGLGVLAGLVASMFGLGGYVELSEGRPSGLLLSLGASAIPLAALAGVIETIRARGSFPRARAAVRGAHLKVRGYMVRSNIRDGAPASGCTR